MSAILDVEAILDLRIGQINIQDVLVESQILSENHACLKPFSNLFYTKMLTLLK